MPQPVTVSWDDAAKKPVPSEDDIFVNIRNGAQVITWQRDDSLSSFDIIGLLETGEFEKKGKPSPKTITITDKATRAGVFKYTIIGTSADGQPGVNDPRITNGSR